MNPATASKAVASRKAPTGIAGFDEICGGGLPLGRTTLLVGGPGSGKTIFGLQFLVHGAQQKEPGIVVAFEETSKRLVINAAGFGWKLGALIRRKKLFFLDAQPAPDLIQSGSFDLSGMLAALGFLVDEMGAKRIVFDALDMVLALLPDPAAKRREIYRLHEWLLTRELTGIINAKADGDETGAAIKEPLGFMQFMVDCAVILEHRVSLGVSHRSLRVQKYRGSSFDENESAFLIGERGIEVRFKALQVERVAKRIEQALLARTTQTHKGELSRGRTRMGQLRGADAATSAPKAKRP